MNEAMIPKTERWRRWHRIHRYKKYRTDELLKMLHDKERQIQEIQEVLAGPERVQEVLAERENDPPSNTDKS